MKDVEKLDHKQQRLTENDSLMLLCSQHFCDGFFLVLDGATQNTAYHHFGDGFPLQTILTVSFTVAGDMSHFFMFIS